MRETSINEIERINIILLVGGSMASAVVTRDYLHFLSFAAGSAIMTLNFRFLRRLIEGIFAGEEMKKNAFLIRLPLKFLCLIALVVIVFVWGNVNVLFFVLGLSTLFASILANQVIIAFSPPVRRDQDGT